MIMKTVSQISDRPFAHNLLISQNGKKYGIAIKHIFSLET
jgi:hypothetical protein